MRAERIRAWSAAIFLGACLMLGGASGPGAGAVGNGLLQVAGVSLILLCLWTARDVRFSGSAKLLIGIVGTFLLLALLYLFPLPFTWWTALPGREPVAAAFHLAGIAPTTLPVSLAPQNSIASLMWLVPPTAMFLLVLTTSHGGRKRLPWVILGMAILSIFLGVAQLLGGEESTLRFYDITNRNAPVGFFSNTNHFATLLLCALPFAGYLAARSVASSGSARLRRSSGFLLAIAVGMFLLVGVAITGSLAGLALLLPAAIGAFLIYLRAFGPLARKWWAAAGGLFLLFVGLAFFGPLNEQAISDKLSDRPNSRKVIAQTSLEAIGDFFPVGSGLGSFVEIYRTYEEPNPTSNSYVNHAHNDYIEIVLETGAVGLLLIVAFLIWYGVNAFRVWRSDLPGANLARAGTVLIGIVLLHNLVDYPLRTAAVAALFAAACGLMQPAPLSRRQRKASAAESEQSKLRHLEAV